MPVGDRFNKRMQMGCPLTLSIALTSRVKVFVSIENKLGNNIVSTLLRCSNSRGSDFKTVCVQRNTGKVNSAFLSQYYMF